MRSMVVLVVCASALLVWNVHGRALIGEFEQTTVQRENAIRAANQRYRDAWLTNDPDSVMATLTPDAILLPSGMSPIAGAAAIRAFWFPAAGPATTVTAMELVVDDVVQQGDVAVVRGTGTLSFRLRFPDGRQQASSQRSWYVNVLHRQADGRWLIASRAWSDLRAPAEPPLPGAGVRGSAEAVAAAKLLLQHVGGDAWRARVMEVTERGYLANGDQFDLRITRDFGASRRLLERNSSSGRFVEWIAGDRGWTEQDGTRQAMSDERRAAEHYGIKQEPYAIYHRLAIGDATLRVDLRDRKTRLLVYDQDDRVLCWFRLDAQGRPIGWGNFFDGQINEHYYGPLAPFGSINLPRWGASTSGAFRFEYQGARLSAEPLREPGS